MTRRSTHLLNSATFALFAAVHVWLVYQGNNGFGTPMGDITTAYQPWLEQMQGSGLLLGLTATWVYPFPNLLFEFAPTWLPTWLGYQTAWLTVVTALDLTAAGVILWTTFGGKHAVSGRRARWGVATWAGLLLALGPTSISRLDTPSVALAVIAVVLWLRGRQVPAIGLMALAVWFKVWPVALLAGMVVSARHRLRAIGTVSAVGLGVLGIGALLGSLANVLSFVTMQSGRGIQIESPWAAPWLWGGVLHLPDSGLYYDNQMKTFQVIGEASHTLAALLGPVMYVALGITIFLGWAAARRTRNENKLLEIVAWVGFTGALDLIVFNKVGSPQYYGWLIAPVLLAVLASLPRWRFAVIGAFVVLVLTQLVYPVAYDAILASDAGATALLTLRNAVAIALLVHANLRLGAIGKERA